MTDITKSEGYTKIRGLMEEYKKFNFGLVSRVPYRSIKRWIGFTDNRIQDAFKEKRSLWDNIRDNYVLVILWGILGFISMWYLWLFVLFVLGSIITFAAIINPSILLVIPAMILLVIVVAPLYLLLRSLLYHIVPWLLGGKGSYTDTMSVLVFANAAQFILSIGLLLSYAVIVGFFISPLYYAIWAYAVYLTYKGFRHVHKLNRNQAIGAALVPLFIELLIWSIIITLADLMSDILRYAAYS